MFRDDFCNGFVIGPMYIGYAGVSSEDQHLDIQLQKTESCRMQAHLPGEDIRRAAAVWSGITKSCPMPNRLSSHSGVKLGCLTTNTAPARTARVKRRPFHCLNF